jgi:putative membrane protein
MSDPHVGIPLAQNPFLRRLVAVYLAFWLWAALFPVERSTWLLENLLVFALLGLLAATHRRFVFSNLSYGLIFAFLALHTVGSHYTYSAVPAGFWVRDALGLERNHYDRLVHFAFGLLLAYPIREVFLRAVHVHRVWSWVVPVLVMLALSSAYEILEWWAARLSDPDVGMAFVGAQGDVWDGQKDMTLALAGSILAMVIAAWLRRRGGHEPYLLGRARPSAAASPSVDTSNPGLRRRVEIGQRDTRAHITARVTR